MGLVQLLKGIRSRSPNCTHATRASKGQRRDGGSRVNVERSVRLSQGEEEEKEERKRTFCIGDRDRLKVRHSVYRRSGVS